MYEACVCRIYPGRGVGWGGEQLELRSDIIRGLETINGRGFY